MICLFFPKINSKDFEFGIFETYNVDTILTVDVIKSLEVKVELFNIANVASFELFTVFVVYIFGF